MTFPKFDEFQAKLLAEVVKMKDTKGKEYTNGAERFDNFNEEARDVDVDRLKVAEIFLNKHMRAIKNYVCTGKVFSNEPIRGRIVDAITYLTLIAGMIEEDLMNQDTIKVEGIVDQNTGKHQPFEFGPSQASQIFEYNCKLSNCDFTTNHYTRFSDHLIKVHNFSLKAAISSI